MTIDIILEVLAFSLKVAAALLVLFYFLRALFAESSSAKIKIPSIETNKRVHAPFVYKPYTSDSGLNMAICTMEQQAANSRR